MEEFLAIGRTTLSLCGMAMFFRHKIVVYLFSAALFFAFGLKTVVSIGSKWSIALIEMEDEFPSEEDKSAKEEKSGRSVKKMWYFDVPSLGQISAKDLGYSEAHNRVYLLAIISEPLITILIEPPEFG